MARSVKRAQTSTAQPLRVFRDDIQRQVELYFIKGCSLPEVEEKLHLPELEASKRYAQVVKFYHREAGKMDEAWAKVQALCILKQSYQRCEEINHRINQLLRDNPEVLPLKEYQVLREEQKLQYKIVSDIRRENVAPQKAVSGGALLPGLPAAETAKGDSLRSKFSEVKAAWKALPSYSLTQTEEKDLEVAVTTGSLFEEEEEEDY